MQRLALPFILVFLAACGGNQAEPATSDAAGGVCPYTTEDACIDQDALAQCEVMAAQCGDQMQVLESCPLQFTCPEG